MANNKKRFKGNSPQLKNIYEVVMEMTVLNGEKYPASKELIDTYDKDGNSNRTLFFAADRSIEDYSKNIWNLKPIK